MSVSVNVVNLEESKKCFDSKDENQVQSEPTLLKDSISFGKNVTMCRILSTRMQFEKYSVNANTNICIRRISEFPKISRGQSKFLLV